MYQKIFFIVLVSFLLAGCSVYRVDSKDATLDFYPPKDSPQKVIYLEKVDKPNEVIGVVTVEVERTAIFEEVLAKMKEEAATLGGDGITDVHQDAPVTPFKVLSNANIRVRYSAKVLVFK